VCLGTSAFALNEYRLRANINPGCATSSSLKYSDIYADGNIAVMGSYNCRGVFIFDISNPDAPVLSSWYNPTGLSGSKLQFLEAIVIGNRGYFGAGGGTDGVHIVDLSNPVNPTLLGKVNSTSGGGHNTIHEMMVFDHEGARYLLENSNSSGSIFSLKIINVTDPLNPVLKHTFTPGGWVHAMHIRGNKMYLSGFTGSQKIFIYDITNLGTQTPALLGSVLVGGNSNHSAWTNETGEYLYSAREFSNGDLQVYDVRNPLSPLLVRRIFAADLNINSITPHNPVVMGNNLYVAWYQAGTQIFDISQPDNPVRVGQYDTYPAEFNQSESEKEILATAKPGEIICGTDSFGNGLPTSYGGNWAVFPFLGEDKVLLGDLATGLYIIDVTASNNVSDFDGDGKTDYSTWSPASGNWTVERSSDAGSASVNWGQTDDIPVAGDYDGDGKSDHAIFRPSTGTWWFIYSSNGSRPAVQFGSLGDVPVTGDYDGDGKTDIAVFRPTTGVWYIAKSSGGISYIGWGLAEDKPLALDYDGDGKSDVAVWRPSTGVWYVIKSSDSGFVFFGFGQDGDRPLATDLNGDGRTEFTIYRPADGVWHIWDPANSSYFGYGFGVATDIPIPADYDGDGKTDIAVFRPGTNDWYRLNSSNGAFVVRSYGSGGDVPSPSSVQPQ
jgi:hypothetical protein